MAWNVIVGLLKDIAEYRRSFFRFPLLLTNLLKATLDAVKDITLYLLKLLKVLHNGLIGNSQNIVTLKYAV